MFQVNGYSLVGVSHHHAIQILKSVGYDVVVVVSRPHASQQPDVRSNESSETNIIRNSQTSLTNIFSPKKPQPSVEKLSSLSESPLPTYTDYKTSSLMKLGHPQSSKEYLTVAESQASPSHRPTQSGSHGTLGMTRASLSSTIQQLTKEDCEESDAMQPLLSRQDSKTQDQVLLS